MSLLITKVSVWLVVLATALGLGAAGNAFSPASQPSTDAACMAPPLTPGAVGEWAPSQVRPGQPY